MCENYSFLFILFVILERKSRFEVQHLPPSTPIDTISALNGNFDTQQVKLESAPMARESSFRHQRTLSGESVNSVKVSRFSIEKEDANGQPQEMVHPFETSTVLSGSPEYRKKGRFELTGGMTTAERLESPQTTLNSTSNQASIAASIAATKPTQQMSSSDHQQALVYGQMEALLKQTEIQKSMLNDLMFGLNTISNGGLPNNIPTSRTRSSSFDIRKMSTSSGENPSGLQHINPIESKYKEIFLPILPILFY